MKKYLTLLLTLCLLFCVSCNSEKNNNPNSPPQINVNEINNSATISFESYEQLYQSLSVSTSKAHEELISKTEKYNLSEEYTSLLNKFSKGEIELYIPAIDNTPLEMKEETGGITMFSSELYYLPWIWYRGEYNNGSVVVCITYTDIIKNVENCKTYLEVLNIIAPDAPNPNNFADKDYVKIEEVEKNFNGEMRTALFKHASSGRTYYGFLYNGMLVSIWSHSSETLDDTFWQKFNLVPYSEMVE